MRAMSPVSLLLSALLAFFGQLASADVLPPGSCPQHDPLEYTVLLPHPSDCTSYFACSNGVPIEMHCPAGLHFNDNLKVCDWPQNANCVKRCFPLKNDEGGTWSPSSCTEGYSDQGATCKLQCNQDYQLRGSSAVDCTDESWHSVNGDFIPRCQPEECIGNDLDNDLNKTLSTPAGILFILDESGSVGLANFQKNMLFVKDVINKYPLSADRSAGVITFDSGARIQIHLNTDSTSNFLNAVDKVAYSGGGTSILAGLQLALTEINNYNTHDLTVVVLITDGQSSTDGTPAADIIKNAGNPLFAIGIDYNNNLLHLEALSSMGDNGIKHFFHVTSYDALENIGHYLNRPATSDGSSNSSKCSDE